MAAACDVEVPIPGAADEGGLCVEGVVPAADDELLWKCGLLLGLRRKEEGEYSRNFSLEWMVRRYLEREE